MTIPISPNQFQTAPTHTPRREVKTMALRRRKASAEAARRAWDSLSEADKSALLKSPRHEHRSTIDRAAATASVLRRFQ